MGRRNMDADREVIESILTAQHMKEGIYMRNTWTVWTAEFLGTQLGAEEKTGVD